MKNFLISLFLLTMCNLFVNAAVMEGGISKTGMGNTSMIVDNATNIDRKSTRLNSSHIEESRMPSSA